MDKSSDLMQGILAFLTYSWDFFTELTIPGTDITFAALFVGLFLAVLGLRFLGMMLDMSFGTSGVLASGRREVEREKREKGGKRHA